MDESSEETPVDKQVRRLLRRMKKGRAIVIESAEGQSVPLASREAAARAIEARRPGRTSAAQFPWFLTGGQAALYSLPHTTKERPE